MNKKNGIYYLVNILAIVLSIMLLGYYIYKNIDVIHITAMELMIYLILFIILSITKCIRLYVIFLEEKIPFTRFVLLYIKTTFVNIMIPFKLGDIFRMYCFGKEISNYKKGILGILLDRFIDTSILLMFLIPLEILKNGSLSFITTLLITFVLLVCIFILMVPNTYKYLNKYLIINKTNKMSLYMLDIIEKINELYKSGLELLKGRVHLLIMLSVFAWIIDFYIIKIIAIFKINSFDVSIFIQYLTSAVYQPTHIVLMHYSIIVAIVFASINFIIYGMKYCKKIGGVRVR